MKDEYLCILKIGRLYISNVTIDSYDSEISVNFTSKFYEAKRFDANDIESFKSMLELLIECSFIVITEVKESKDE